MSELVAEFEILGEPVSKGRPRFAMVAGRPRTYTPADTIAAEKVVADAFRAAAPNYVAEDGWLYTVHAIFELGTSRRKDLDNLLKLCLDALNGVAYQDDVHVHEIHARKVFVLSKASAKTLIRITRIPSLYAPSKKRGEKK